MKLRLALLLVAAPLSLSVATPVLAHQLNVFASTDCEVLVIEAKFSTGRIPVIGEVQVKDGEDNLLVTSDLGEDGTLTLPLEGLDATTGLLIEVNTGEHDDYWIMTPDEIASKCRS